MKNIKRLYPFAINFVLIMVMVVYSVLCILSAVPLASKIIGIVLAAAVIFSLVSIMIESLLSNRQNTQDEIEQ